MRLSSYVDLPMRVPPGQVVTALFVVTLNAALLVYFHDWFWSPADDGHYAHIAERLLDGEVLNAQVESLHGGYHHVVNVAALALFGRRFLSLRYPLVAAAFVQALLLLVLLWPRGPRVAALASLAGTGLGVLQFLNPSPYWYALLLACGSVAWLTWVPCGTRARVEIAGLLVALGALFQQLPGATTALGVLTYLLLEPPAGRGVGHALVARLLVTAMLAVLLLYLRGLSDAAAVALLGASPVLILCWAWCHVRRSNREALQLVGRFAAGALTAALPLLAHHVRHGSLAAWWDDAMVRPLGFPRLTFISSVGYRELMAIGLRLVTAPAGLADVVNGLYWIVLPLVPAANGLCLLARLVRRPRDPVPALPLVATFYALVCLRYQIPVYLAYTVPLATAGWLWLAPRVASPLVVGLVLVGIVYHAGEPIRDEGMFRGERQPLVRADTLPRLGGLWIDREVAATYAAVVDRIRRETAPGEAIFALPYSPELYFLAERPNPFRFSLLPLHLRDGGDVDALIADLERAAPRLVIHRVRDKYNQPLVAPVLEAVRARYTPLVTIGPFVLYRRP